MAEINIRKGRLITQIDRECKQVKNTKLRQDQAETSRQEAILRYGL